MNAQSVVKKFGILKWFVILWNHVEEPSGTSPCQNVQINFIELPEPNHWILVLMKGCAETGDRNYVNYTSIKYTSQCKDCLVGFVLYIFTQHRSECPMFDVRTLDVIHIRRDLSATLRLISEGPFLKKCVPLLLPPLLGKQRQQISLLLCQSLRTTLGQP